MRANGEMVIQLHPLDDSNNDDDDRQMWWETPCSKRECQSPLKSFSLVSNNVPCSLFSVCGGFFVVVVVVVLRDNIIYCACELWMCSVNGPLGKQLSLLRIIGIKVGNLIVDWISLFSESLLFCSENIAILQFATIEYDVYCMDACIHQLL